MPWSIAGRYPSALAVFMIVISVDLVLAACGATRTGPPAQADNKCGPRPLDAAQTCKDGRAPAPNEPLKEFVLNGPETGGDQGQNLCLGLLLELKYASGTRCKQRIGSFSSIGMGDDVWIDDKPACFRLAGTALAVERDGVTIATVPRQLGMDTARSYPQRCKN